MALFRLLMLWGLACGAWALDAGGSYLSIANDRVTVSGTAQLQNMNVSGSVYMPNPDAVGGMVAVVDASGKLYLASPTISALSALTTSPVSVYNSATLLIQPKVLIKSGTVSAGTAVFYLTLDGTSGGTAMFANVYGVNVDVNASDAAYGYSWALSNANRTLTVSVVKPGTLLALGLLPYVSAANGVNINVRVFGN